MKQDQVPTLFKAALQDGTYQPGGTYHTTHEARLDHTGARATWNMRGLWGSFLLNSRDKLLVELFPDLNEEYNDWHLTSTDPCKPGAAGRRGPKCCLQDLTARRGPARDPDDGGRSEQLPPPAIHGACRSLASNLILLE